MRVGSWEFRGEGAAASLFSTRHSPLPTPNPSPRRRRYSATVGRSEALMAVVDARSYSRNSGSTSQLRLTVMPAASIARPRRRSCSGLTKLNSRHTAACRRPRCWTSRTRRSISPSSSGVTTSPRASTRSRTANQFCSGVIGGGRTTCRAYRCGRFCRPISSRSRKPSVVTKATGSPARWSRALVATVEPCTTWSTAPPSPVARPIASSTPRSNAGGVDDTFTTFSSPAPGVERHQIRERPAHVHADEQARRRRLLTLSQRHIIGPKCVGPAPSSPCWSP